MFNACIVGAGSIGALKPDKYDSPKSKNILTHAHALYSLKEYFKEIFVVDPDYKKRNAVKKKWNFVTKDKVFSLNNNKIDIFVVATPTDYHYSVVREILNLSILPNIIIVEKPFCNNLNEALEIHKLCNKHKIKLVVNYTRRFCPTINRIKNDLHESKYGEVQSCNIIYTRGLVRDACHALDLCNYFFGDFVKGKITGDIDCAIDDYSELDLTYPAWLKYKNCRNVFLSPADGRKYSIFEIDIITNNGRITFIDHSRQTKIYLREPEPVYGDFMTLDYNCNETINNNLENALYHLHTNCLGYLEAGKPKDWDFICTSFDALKIHEIYKHLAVT